MEVNCYARCHKSMGPADSEEEDRRMYMVRTITLRGCRHEVSLYAEDREWQPNANAESDDEEDRTCEGDNRRTRAASETFQRRESRLAGLAEILKLGSPEDALEVEASCAVADEYYFTCCDPLQEKCSSKHFFLKPSVATWYHLPRAGSMEGQAIRPLDEVAPPGAQAESKFHLLPSVGTWFAKPRPPRLNLCIATGDQGSSTLLVQVYLPTSALSSKRTKPRNGSPKSALSSRSQDRLVLPLQSEKGKDDEQSPIATSARSPHFDKSVDVDSPKRSKDSPKRSKAVRPPGSAAASHADKVDGLSPHRLRSPQASGNEEVERRKVVGHGKYMFRVSVPTPYPGVQYRKSMNLEDRWPRFAENEKYVCGTIKDDARWLKLDKDVYLPMQVGDVKILKQVNADFEEDEFPQRVTRTTTAHARLDAEIPWWMIWCSVCSTSASTDTEVLMESRGVDV